MSKKENSSNKRRTRGQEIWHQFKKNKGAMIGIVIIAILLLISIFADQLWDYKDVVTKMNVRQKLTGVTSEHPFGTDYLGRDMLARIGYGTRYSLLIGFGTCVIAIIFGSTVGAIAGYYGDPIETVIMRIVEIFIMIPGLLLLMVFVTVNDVRNIIR